MSEAPKLREILAWAEDTVARSKAITNDTARVRGAARDTRAASQRLRQQTRPQRATNTNRRNG